MRKMTAVLALCLLAGCAYQRAEIKSPAFDEQLEKPRLSYAGGSIWQAASSALTDDLRARKKGDTVTVVISEQSTASKEATTGTKRSSALSAGVPNLLGLETNMTGIKNWMDLSKLLNASTSSTYDGSGTTTRKENLAATITAKVLEVLPNGNFLIEGRRNVRVNNEDQIIILEGTVRPRDINSDNVVNSSYIADARISYTGKGDISDRQKPGWLMSVVDKVWPF